MDRLSKYPSVVHACNRLMEQLNCDFIGLAIQNQSGPEVSWHYAIGNSNDKYKRISVRYGKGIAGKVISTGRPMIMNSFPNEFQGKALEYPIMLAENLISSYAVPILYKGSPKGVLLIGHRKPYVFTDAEQREVQETSKNMDVLFNKEEAIVSQLKKELVQPLEQELQRMASRIIDVQEEERKSISRNLHDGLGQNLYSHLITINLLQSEIDHPLLEQVQKEAQQLIEEVRDISWELRPSVLDDLGLVPAIRSYLVRFQRYYKIDVAFDCKLQNRLEINKELAIYRIIQESLTNIRKYAETDHARITMKEISNAVKITIEDQGKGFDGSQISRGVGIFSMEERAKAVGGIFHIDSISGKGTCISLEIPD